MIDSNVSQRLRNFYESRHMLLHMHMDILYACDLDCQHCYLDEKSKMKPVKKDAIVDALTQAAQIGCMDLLFSGGEIFLRKDLIDLIAEARRLKYRVRLKTHGGRIKPEDVNRLKELGVSQVDFSVYALDEDVHDAFTQRKGSLMRTLRGIDLIRQVGIPVEVKCSITRLNEEHYQELHNYFDKRGIEMTINAEIRGTNSGKTTTYPLNVDYETKVQLNLFKIQVDGSLRDRPEPQPAHKAKLCYAGITSIYVAPDLQVYPCSAFPSVVGDLSVQSLHEIWSNAQLLKTLRKTTRLDIKGCFGCPARKYCSYCVGAAHIETGDYAEPPKLICETAFAWKEASERYAAGDRAPVQAPSARKKKGLFNIATTLPTAAPKTAVCSNC